MKTIQIDLTSRTKKSPVSDGIGGQHADGAVVELPDEVADALIGLKIAFPVDGSSLIAAKAAAKEREKADKIQRVKVEAMRQMQIHDSLPAEVRTLVYEHGDKVTEQYLAHVRAEYEASARPIYPIQQVYPAEPVRRRGRPRKHPRLDA